MLLAADALPFLEVCPHGAGVDPEGHREDAQGLEQEEGQVEHLHQPTTATQPPQNGKL